DIYINYEKRGIEGMKKKELYIYIPIIAALVVGYLASHFTSFVSANESETKDKYDLYPTPHSVEYGEGELTLDKEIEVVYDDTIDDVTKEKLSTIFKENDLSDPKVVDEPSDDTITIY